MSVSVVISRLVEIFDHLLLFAQNEVGKTEMRIEAVLLLCCKGSFTVKGSLHPMIPMSEEITVSEPVGEQADPQREDGCCRAGDHGRTKRDSGTNRDSSRRRFLSLVAGSTAVSLAGCQGDQSSDDSDQSEERNQTDDRQRTDTTGREFDPFDEAMNGYIDDLDIPGGVLGVARNGEVVLQRGYGWVDDATDTETPPDALARIASISKSLTKAAVGELAANGRLSPADSAIDYLDIEPPDGAPADERFGDITIQQLVDHESGLPASRVPDDPAFRPRQVADTLDLDTPPDSGDFVRYLLDRPLAYEPGTDSRYSNSGYAVLGHVVAGAADQPYHRYLEEAVLPAPADIGLARTDPDEREPRELSYHSAATAPTALSPDSDREVPLPDGGFLVEMLGGAGGHYSSTRALLAFMQEYWIYFGRPRSESVPVDDPAAIGSLPGSYAVAFHQGPVDVVALFNRRVPGQSDQIIDRLRTAVGEIDWPR